jgi:ribonuclease T2
MRAFFASLLVCFLFSVPADAQATKKKAGSAASFDYYILVLSYAPDFCDQPTGRKDPRECGPGRKLGFIVHGLWPQNETSRGPQNCGGVSPVSRAIIQATLKYIPVDSLIQHEWTAHGSCTGMTAAEYFAALRRARDSVNIPSDLNQPSQALQLSPAQVEAKLATANPSFLKTAFRTSCYRNAELQDVRVCLNKDLSPRACTSSAGECPAPAVTLLPVR